MKTVISLSAGHLYVTYGMSKSDVERRASQGKEFGMVGTGNIVELHKPKITLDAIKTAEARKYVAIVVFDKDLDKEVAFKEL